jgi:intracellular sulfur oxidation DsrE/DsrF family protein
MSEERKVSEEMQNAFVDGQLDAAEWASVSERLERDAALREDVCELRTLKDLVRHAYAAPPVPRAPARGTGVQGWRTLAAASVAFAAFGWFGHAWWGGVSPPALDPASAYALRGDWHALRSDWRSLEGSRVLVHVSSGSREALHTALDEVEDLLRTARAAQRSIEVEIVANSSGLDLLSATASPHAQRVAALRRAYSNLSLVACGQTLERRRASGQPVELLPGTQIAPSALEQVVKRLQGGWVYVRA